MKRKNIKIAGMIVAASLMAVSVCGCADKGEEASATDYSNEEIIDHMFSLIVTALSKRFILIQKKLVII